MTPVHRHRSGDYSSIVAAAYRTDLELGGWLQGIADAAVPLLDEGRGLTVSALDRDSQGGYRVRGTTGAGASNEARERWRTADHAWLARRFGHVPRVRRIGDAVGIAGMNQDGQGLLIGTLVPPCWQLPPARRRLLTGVAVHLAAAYRLKRSAFAFRGSAGMGAAPAEDGLALWQGVLDGRWSVVDRHDVGGKRLLFAVRSGAGPLDPWALNQREGQVARLAAAGSEQKQIAYELGLSPSTVSVHLNNALRKLRCNDVAELRGIVFGASTL